MSDLLNVYNNAKRQNLCTHISARINVNIFMPLLAPLGRLYRLKETKDNARAKLKKSWGSRELDVPCITQTSQAYTGWWFLFIFTCLKQPQKHVKVEQDWECEFFFSYDIRKVSILWKVKKRFKFRRLLRAFFFLLYFFKLLFTNSHLPVFVGKLRAPHERKNHNVSGKKSHKLLRT